jgi:catechol 2,3-dioxygenase-like lactoylglutathione lyase family enzyme
MRKVRAKFEDNIKGEHSMTDKPVTPRGINHLVLNVRNLEESHKFWTEVVGMQQVGELKPAPNRPNPPRMRFYSGTGAGGTHHHDMALVENPSLPEPPVEWSMVGMPMAINHIAITYPNREAAAAAHLSAGQRREIRPACRARHDPQPLYP